tara:strand:- start:611 stop:1486 length:876 start_codon:yes stop_codon:yes gene_type:complete
MQEGSINEAEWESNSTMPDAKLKYRMGYERPQPVFPLPLSSAFADMVQMGKADMEDISGIQARMQGQGTGSSEPYRGLLAIDEYSTRRIKEWMKSMVEPALEHLGNVFLETARATYTAKKVFRIVQPGAGDGDGLDERQLALNVPIYNDLGKEINKMFDYASARFDVRYIAGSTLPVNRHALRDEYFRYYQSGLIDDVAMIAETDIRNKEELLKRKSVYSELKEQSARLEAMVKDRDGVIETLSRQLVQADIKDQSRTAGLEIRKDVLETEAQQKLYRKEQQERKKSKEKT